MDQAGTYQKVLHTFCGISKYSLFKGPWDVDQGENPDDVVQSFLVVVFRRVIDQIVTSITEHFLQIQS